MREMGLVKLSLELKHEYLHDILIALKKKIVP